MVDTLWMFAGSEPQWVLRGIGRRIRRLLALSRGWRTHPPELEPGVSDYIHFKNGVRAFYNNSKRMFGRRDIASWGFFGTMGYITVNDQHAIAEIETENGTKKISCPPNTCVDSPAAIRELIIAMEEGGEICSPPSQGRFVLEVMLAFMASQRKGNVRIDLPLDENAV